MAQEPLGAQCPEGAVAGEAPLRKVPGVRELGHRTTGLPDVTQLQVCILDRYGMEGLRGSVPQLSTAQLPEVLFPFSALPS